jgi:cytochrome c
MMKSLLMVGFVALAFPACTTTVVSGPDPVPLIGAQVIASSGACADLRDGVTVDGTPIVLFHCHGSPNQRWFVRNGGISESFGSCLDVQGSAATEGAPIILVTCNGSPSQQWGISNGQIIGIGGKCLDAMGGGTMDLTPLILSGCKVTPSQQWTVQ